MKKLENEPTTMRGGDSKNVRDSKKAVDNPRMREREREREREKELHSSNPPFLEQN
jgi:hypothetical protein